MRQRLAIMPSYVVRTFGVCKFIQLHYLKETIPYHNGLCIMTHTVQCTETSFQLGLVWLLNKIWNLLTCLPLTIATFCSDSVRPCDSLLVAEGSNFTCGQYGHIGQHQSTSIVTMTETMREDNSMERHPPHRTKWGNYTQFMVCTIRLAYIRIMRAGIVNVLHCALVHTYPDMDDIVLFLLDNIQICAHIAH